MFRGLRVLGNPFERAARVLRDARRGSWQRMAPELLQRLERVRGIRVPAREQEIRDTAERIQIGALIQRALLERLRGNERWSAHQLGVDHAHSAAPRRHDSSYVHTARPDQRTSAHSACESNQRALHRDQTGCTRAHALAAPPASDRERDSISMSKRARLRSRSNRASCAGFRAPTTGAAVSGEKLRRDIVGGWPMNVVATHSVRLS